MLADIADYYQSCVTCHRVGKVGDVHRAPLQPLPLIDEHFKRVVVDIIGPLALPSSSGKHYILRVVDYATCYLEAVALSSLQADKVAVVLLGIYTRVGFPAKLNSDKGPQFVSKLMQALCQKIQMTISWPVLIIHERLAQAFQWHLETNVALLSGIPGKGLGLISASSSVCLQRGATAVQRLLWHPTGTVSFFPFNPRGCTKKNCSVYQALDLQINSNLTPLRYLA